MAITHLQLLKTNLKNQMTTQKVNKKKKKGNLKQIKCLLAPNRWEQAEFL